MSESSATSIELFLTNLITQFIPGLDPDGGRNLAKACAVCLYGHQHSTPVTLELAGEFSGPCIVIWEPAMITDQLMRSWGDPDEAAENGAAGLAILLTLACTEYTIVGRSRKGTGFDYWLGYEYEGPLFPDHGRLEVSGIYQGKEGDINYRTKVKIGQTRRSDTLHLPAYAIVVEFSRPKAKSAYREAIDNNT